MEQEKTKLTISEYINLCKSYEQDPSEENYTNIQDFLSFLQVKEYIPLRDKIILVASVVHAIPFNFDALGVVSNVEMSVVTKILLSYAINLNVDIEDSIINTYPVYDMIMQYGLFDTIHKHTQKDYERTINMVERVINVQNIFKLAQTSELFDDNKFDQWLDAMQNFKNDLSPEMLHDLATIARLNTAEDQKEFLDSVANVSEDFQNHLFESDMESLEQAKETDNQDKKEDLS